MQLSGMLRSILERTKWGMKNRERRVYFGKAVYMVRYGKAAYM